MYVSVVLKCQYTDLKQFSDIRYKIFYEYKIGKIHKMTATSVNFFTNQPDSINIATSGTWAAANLWLHFLFFYFFSVIGTSSVDYFFLPGSSVLI